ncbi:MAG TPA: AAA family ATPase, partial [Polyangiaceae bacterium]|nr:AAA family ATPase [Polyangiaceae bacterium]
LYSLGALGYLLLTGRTAYAARSLADLPQAFRVRPEPPHALVGDIPEALSHLVLSMLSLDVAGRPRTAAEVIERLSALAGLPEDPRLVVASAHLVTPALTGRQAELARIRRCVARTLRGRGSTLLLSGAAGTGRTRVLDTCALEAKLVGALVLRAQPSREGTAPFGVIQSLLRHLDAALTPVERERVVLDPEVRSELRSDAAGHDAGSSPLQPALLRDARVNDRVRCFEALSAFLLAVAREHPLVLLVDDFDRLDEPSAAWLASLARETQQAALTLLAAIDPTNPSPTAPLAWRSLAARSRPLVLAPLSAHDSEALLGSVFGAVPNLSVVADRVFAVAGGNSRLTLDLAQHLVDRGLIRYENGQFELPDALEAEHFPTSVGEMLRSRARLLSEQARQLGAIVALCDGAALTRTEALSLCSSQDPAVCQAALAELCAARFVIQREELLSVPQTSLSEALCALDDTASVRGLRVRIADLFARDPARRLRAAEQYFLAAESERALAVLLGAFKADPAGVTWFPGLRALLERGARESHERGLPAGDTFLLQRSLTHHVLHYLEPCDRGYLIAQVRVLEQASGLTDHAALAHVQDAGARLQKALASANARYQATPERERILNPAQAIPALARLVQSLATYASAALDIELLNALPSLAPFAPLAPAIAVGEVIVQGVRDLRAGRNQSYFQKTTELIHALDRSEARVDGSSDQQVLKLALTFGAGLISACLGQREEALDYANALDVLPSQSLNAWRIRQLACTYTADQPGADHAREHVEQLKIQYGPRQFLHGATLETEVTACGWSDDLLGLRRIVPELDAMAARHPGWRTLSLLARSYLERFRGRPDQALELIDDALASASAHRHSVWAYAAAARTQTLLDLGRAEEGRDFGRWALERCAEARMEGSAGVVWRSLAECEGVLGDHASALLRIAPILARVE